ncbi:hypothetical protein ACWEQG_20975 [Microbispora sp. NPDC004025]
MPLPEAIPPVRGKHGRPRQHPDVVLGDRGYDRGKYRKLVRALGVRPQIARPGTEHDSGLGKQRWVVEQAIGPAPWFPPAGCASAGKSARTFLSLGCALIYWRRPSSSR